MFVYICSHTIKTATLESSHPVKDSHLDVGFSSVMQEDSAWHVAVHENTTRLDVRFRLKLCLCLLICGWGYLWVQTICTLFTFFWRW